MCIVPLTSDNRHSSDIFGQVINLNRGLLREEEICSSARDARLQSACFVEAIMWPSSTFTWVWLQYHKSARIVPWLVGLLVFGVRWLSWRFEVRIRYKCQVFKQFYYVGSHLKTLSELRKESEQSKHKELVNHLPSVGCKHCIKGDSPQPVAVHNHWLTGGLLLRFGLLGKEGGIIGIRTWWKLSLKKPSWARSTQMDPSGLHWSLSSWQQATTIASLWSLQDTRVMRWFKHIVDSWKGWTPWSTDKQTCCWTAPEEMPWEGGRTCLGSWVKLLVLPRESARITDALFSSELGKKALLKWIWIS